MPEPALQTASAPFESWTVRKSNFAAVVVVLRFLYAPRLVQELIGVPLAAFDVAQ
jgi:hypothetical protein